MTVLEAIEISTETTLENLVALANPNGLFLEFGVYQGYTLNRIANSTSNLVFGFDSFEGLPEDWFTYEKNHFKCDPPVNLNDNALLRIGLFEDSLPEFLKEYDNDISFIHIDCDLYSSTKTIFDNVKNRLMDGCIIVFDELYGYEGWELHEYKAFEEFLQETKYSWECVGKYSAHQAGFKINVQ